MAVSLSFSAFGQTVYEQLEVVSPLPTPNHITNLSYGNGKFLATTERGGIVLSSEDGINWEVHNTPHPNSLEEITYGNGLYCAASSGSGPVYFSSDLANWTTVSSNNLPTNNDNVYFNNDNGLFYFGGGSFGSNPGIVTSSDGVTFNHVPTPAESTIRDFIFANNLFVTVGDNLEIMTSANGTDWTLQTVDVDIPDGDLGEGLLNIRYHNSLYIVGGKANTLLTSPDGITWTKRDFSEDTSWFYESWFNAGTYYFPGRQGTIWTTTDFTVWTGIDLDANDTVQNIVNAEGITVVTGRGGNIFTSTDLSSWTNRKTGFTESFPGVAFGAGVFVAVDFDGNAINSVDGVTWENSSPPGLNNSWNFIIFADGKFVAMTSSGEWTLSADGKIWSPVSAELDPFPGINAFQYLNGKWFVVGRDGFIRSSSSLSDLSDWAVHDVTTDNDLWDIGFGNGVYVAVGRAGALYSSTDGVSWDLRDSGTTEDLWEVEYGHDKFVVLGGGATGLTSTDGISWSAENQQGPPANPGDLIFRDGQFVVLYTSGRILLSSNGLVWTTVSVSVGEIMNGSAQSDEDLVVVGRNGLILSAALPPKKNLVVNVDGDGTVDISPDGSPYPHLAQVTLTAVAGPDFAFSFWSGDVSDDTNPLIIDMDSDKTITAHFVLSLTGYELWRYLEFTQEERADDEVSGPDADPDEDGLTNNDEFLLGTKPKEFNAPGNLVINIEGEGAVNISPEGGGPYPLMSEVTLTAVGTSEFGFSSWSGDASGETNPLVVAMDDDKTITANFVLTLTGFPLWRYGLFNQEERADESLSGAQADFDGDRLTNFEEYLRGTNPKELNFETGVELVEIEVEGEFYLAIRYLRDKSVGGVEQRVEVGDDLENWLSGPTYTDIPEVVDNGDGTETVTVRLLDTVDSLPQWFIRLVLVE